MEKEQEIEVEARITLRHSDDDLTSPTIVTQEIIGDMITIKIPSHIQEIAEAFTRGTTTIRVEIGGSEIVFNRRGDKRGVQR